MAPGIMGPYRFMHPHDRVIRYIVTAVFSLVAPVLLGRIIDHVQLGLVSALGGLALMNEVYNNSGKRQIRNLVYAIVSSLTAFVTGMAIEGTSLLSLFLLPFIALAASTVGEINREFIRNAGRFLVFLVIGFHFHVTREIGFIFSLCFLAGALWTSLVIASIKIFAGKKDTMPETQKTYTAGQYLRHWRKSLSTLQGWQFPLRITSCLLAAQIVRYFVPGHHSYWILLTVVLVTQHNIEHQIIRIKNRGLGTLLGVVLSFVFVHFKMPFPVVIVFLGILASLRVVFRETNYLLYAAVMTPLVIILLDFGASVSFSLLFDRLAATVIGCVISLIFGFLIWRKFIGSIRPN